MGVAVEVAGTVEADMVPSSETVIVVEEAPEPTSEAAEVVAVEEVVGEADSKVDNLHRRFPEESGASEAPSDEIIDKDSRSANAYIESVDESSGVVVITEPANTGLSSEWVAVPEVIRHEKGV